MPRCDFSESLVNLFQIVMARAMHPIPESKKAELSDLLESEKDYADDYGNKMVAVFKLQRELDELLNDVHIKRRHLEELEGECSYASRRLYEVEHTILDRIGVLHSSSSRGLRGVQGVSQGPSGWMIFGSRR